MENILPKKEYDQIRGLAYKVYNRSFSGIELEDLIQEGVVAYLKMKQKYDKSKNNYFMGFAYKRIYGAMLDWVAKNSVDKDATVRKGSRPQRDKLIVPAPKGLEEYHINNNVETEYSLLLVSDMIKGFLETLTDLELYLLNNVLLEGKAMVRAGSPYIKYKKTTEAIVKNILIALKEQVFKDK